MNALDIFPLATAKAYLMVDFEDDDELITALIQGAVDYFERITNWRLYQRIEYIDTASNEIELFQYPIRSYSIMNYYDSSDVTFTARQLPARITIKFPVDYCYTSSSAVMLISADVGFTDAEQVPFSILTWLKKYLTYTYEKRANSEGFDMLIKELDVYRRMPMF